MPARDRGVAWAFVALRNEPAPVSGPNDWFIDELRRQFQENPRSVPEAWRLKFEQEGAASPPGNGGGPATAPPQAPAAEAPAAAGAASPLSWLPAPAAVSTRA